MNNLKAYSVVNECLHFFTYADNFAIGYFKKQGFTGEITAIEPHGYIKEYDGGQLMQCTLNPNLSYCNLTSVVHRQRQVNNGAAACRLCCCLRCTIACIAAPHPPQVAHTRNSRNNCTHATYSGARMHVLVLLRVPSHARPRTHAHTHTMNIHMHEYIHKHNTDH